MLIQPSEYWLGPVTEWGLAQWFMLMLTHQKIHDSSPDQHHERGIKMGLETDTPVQAVLVYMDTGDGYLLCLELSPVPST